VPLAPPPPTEPRRAPAVVEPPRAHAKHRSPLTPSAQRAAVRAKKASELRRAKISAATAALDTVTQSLFAGGLKAAAGSSKPALSAGGELLRLPSSALWVGNLQASVASTVRVFPDRLEYEFQHPRRPKTIAMCMRFCDMSGLSVSRSSSVHTSDPRGKGAWISFDVTGRLEHFATDPEARSGLAGRGRGVRHLLIEFSSPTAIELLEASRIPALRRVWPKS